MWKHALGNYPLRQIVAGDVQRYVARRLAEVRPATVNREVAFLKRVFNVAIEDGLADANPVRKVRLLREDKRPRPLPQRRGGDSAASGDQ
jgi:site-specific recombinase XerD